MAIQSLSSTAIPLYLIAFPDFGPLDIVLPAGSMDVSYKNNTCPSFIVRRFADRTLLVLYVDHREVQAREVAGGQRFMLQLVLGDGQQGKVLLSTDDYEEVLAHVANDVPPLLLPDERLTVYEIGAGRTAWRVTDAEAHELFALVYVGDGTAMSIPANPEEDAIVFALFDNDGGKPLATIELAGRVDLISFYDSHVGYAPDREPGGPLPIQELIADIAANLLLRLATGPRI